MEVITLVFWFLIRNNFFWGGGLFCLILGCGPYLRACSMVDFGSLCIETVISGYSRSEVELVHDCCENGRLAGVIERLGCVDE